MSNSYCCVPACKSWIKRNPEISFHRFPVIGRETITIQNKLGAKEKIDRHKAWSRNLKIDKPARFAKVCALHFKEEDFFTRYRSTNNKKNSLKRNAVPTQYLPVCSQTEYKERKNTKKQIPSKVEQRLTAQHKKIKSVDVKNEMEREDDYDKDDQIKSCECVVKVENLDTIDSGIEEIKTEQVIVKPENMKPESVKVSRSPGKKNDNHRCNKCRKRYSGYCFQCSSLVFILNNIYINIMSVSRSNTIPTDVLEIRNTYLGKGVFTLKTLPRNVIFGPFEGISADKGTNGLMWKTRIGQLASIEEGNWMQYVNYTPSLLFKNMDIFQFRGKLYYETNKVIDANEELLVHINGEEVQKSNYDGGEYFIPVVEEQTQKIFACTACHLGFSLAECLIEHKTKCPYYAKGYSDVKDRNRLTKVTQCDICTIWLDQEEYQNYHVVYCSRDENQRGYAFPKSPNRRPQATVITPSVSREAVD